MPDRRRQDSVNALSAASALARLGPFLLGASQRRSIYSVVSTHHPPLSLKGGRRRLQGPCGKSANLGDVLELVEGVRRGRRRQLSSSGQVSTPSPGVQTRATVAGSIRSSLRARRRVLLK
jgi:hypothetical protein